MIKRYKTQRAKIKSRVRSKLTGTNSRPRLTVFRSNKHIYAQLIDDEGGLTLTSATDSEIKGTKKEKSKAVGLKIAKIAADKKVKKVIFDRNGFTYHGRVASLAEGAREGGLEF
ncbi:50S ribosomal protein L18 [candidate division WWE3 bacterium RIFCSPLOWO2_01_FULL_42_11]|uniref:Large ribosomal subunit protein uL18 n=1 Tax=candidate division WWE3 bacterium RIFCSPLOWO2_01_FULL_42_11 TaxID=1802627 RepID=A0A1F4VRW0_UNCKA|nr:MAG: 50S ribosomal protein L18 [candidate division WWE3 bacterium RIFCSPLOWO2_01_FULL_42_11]